MYELYADEIFRYSLLYLKDRDLAEDITADTFVRAWRHFSNFDRKNPRAWLYTIAKNLMKDHWRKKPVVALDFEIENTNPDHDPVIRTERILMKEKIHRAIDALPPDMRDVVFLRCIEGQSAKDTAKALQMSVANVRVLQHRGLKKMRGML